MKKIMQKTLSVVLSVLFVLYLVPAWVYADMFDIESEVTDFSENISIVNEPFEVESLREESVKHFRLEDGSYIAAQYEKPVHYLDDNGTWQDIDNTLSEIGSEYTTKNSRIKFAKKITGNETLFTLHHGKYKITMSLDDAIKKTEGSVINSENVSDCTQLQKMMNLENLSSEIWYKDILEGVDLQYIIDSYDVKENIIVKECKNEYEYSFTIKLNNLIASMNEKDEILIVDGENGAIKYVIPSPIVYDTNNVYADKSVVHYMLNAIGSNEYQLIITADADWMNSEDRAYPVIIDPSLSVSQTAVVDLDISSGAPDVNYGSSTTMYVGST